MDRKSLQPIHFHIGNGDSDTEDLISPVTASPETRQPLMTGKSHKSSISSNRLHVPAVGAGDDQYKGKHNHVRFETDHDNELVSNHIKLVGRRGFEGPLQGEQVNTRNTGDGLYEPIANKPSCQRKRSLRKAGQANQGKCNGTMSDSGQVDGSISRENVCEDKLSVEEDEEDVKRRER